MRGFRAAQRWQLCKGGGGSGGSGRGGGSGGGGSASAEPVSKTAAGGYDTPENVDRLTEQFSDSIPGYGRRSTAEEVLKKGALVPGMEPYIREALDGPKNTYTDYHRTGMILDGYRGKFNGEGEVRTARQMRSFAEAAQSVLSDNGSLARIGQYALGKTYERWSNAQKNKFAYEVSNGSYQINTSSPRIPPAMRADLNRRVERIQGAMERASQRADTRGWF